MSAQHLFATGLFLICAASSVAAQSHDETVFIDGTVFASTSWRSQTDVSPPPLGSSSVGLNGTVRGGAATVGAWLSPRVSVRLELSFPVDHNTIGEATAPVAPGVILANRSEVSQHERTAAALVAYHTVRRHRVQLGYLGGVVFVFLTQQDVESTTVLPATSSFPPQHLTFTSTTYAATAEIGLDADVALTGRFSIVPQVRLLADDVSVRPGIALRLHW